MGPGAGGAGRFFSDVLEVSGSEGPRDPVKWSTGSQNVWAFFGHFLPTLRALGSRKRHIRKKSHKFSETAWTPGGPGTPGRCPSKIALSVGFSIANNRTPAGRPLFVPAVSQGHPGSVPRIFLILCAFLFPDTICNTQKLKSVSVTFGCQIPWPFFSRKPPH